MNEEKNKKISKFLSFVLRHNPASIGIVLDVNGWVKINNLIECAAKDGKIIKKEELDEVVKTNDKKRFSYSEDGTKIRANQGHSVSIDLNLSSTTPPTILYHGTVEKFIRPIKTYGLVKGNRQYVHLSADIDTAKQVGSRRGKPIVLTIRALEMFKNNYKFFRSVNGIWLVDNVPIQYIQRFEG